MESIPLGRELSMTFSCYSLDERDVLTSTGGEWDSFARENGGDAATSEFVVGSHLWDHVHGLQVRAYLNAVFFAARSTGRTVSIPYRCDSPNHPRLFVMDVIPGPGHSLTVRHVGRPMQIGQRSGISVDVPQWATFSTCSICFSFLVGDEWFDPMNRPLASDFPKGHSICPACKKDARRQLEPLWARDVKSGSEPK